MKKFSIIVAVDDKMGIGRAGGLPWRLSRDMQRFKALTQICAKPGCQNAVIMGRKTWESLPEKYRPLPGRLNVVLSSQTGIALPKDVLSADSVDKALELLEIRADIVDIFVIGGGAVYAKAIRHKACERLYLTHVSGDFSCDVSFPEIPYGFKIVQRSDPLEEGGIKLYFCDYSKV